MFVFEDYRCEECVEVFEINYQKADGSPDIVTCPVCGSGLTRRLMTMPSVTLDWWNAAASSDSSGIHKRHRPASKPRRARERSRV